MPTFTKVYLAPNGQSPVSYAYTAEILMDFLEGINAYNCNGHMLDKWLEVSFLNGSSFGRIAFSLNPKTFKPTKGLDTIVGLDEKLYLFRAPNLNHHPYPIHDDDDVCIQEAIERGADDTLINAKEFFTIEMHIDEFTVDFMQAIAHHFVQKSNFAVYTVKSEIEPQYIRTF